MGDVKGASSFSTGTVTRLTNRAKPTVSDAFRLQLQVLVTVLGGLHKKILQGAAYWPCPSSAMPSDSSYMYVDEIFPPVPIKKVLDSYRPLPPHTSVLSGSEIKPPYLIRLNEYTKNCFLFENF